MQSRRASFYSHVLISLVLSLVLLASSAAGLRDPINDFCRRFGHQSCVIDRRLYIDGGFVDWNPISAYPANYTSEWKAPAALEATAAERIPARHLAAL